MKKFLSTILAALTAVTFAFGLTACAPETNDNSQFTVYMPDGAPALSMAQLMYENKVIENVALEYNVVVADTINGYVTGETPAADICVLPVNLASKLLGSGAKYKLLGTVTHGNLYVLAANTTETLTTSNLSSLKGKTVGVVNLANVPGLTFKIILRDNGIEFNESGVDSDSVYLKAIGADAIGTLSDVDYYVVPEPAASTKVNNTNLSLNFVGDLQQLYGGENGYPQAVLVAKNEVTSYRNGAFIKSFMQAVEGSAQWIMKTEVTGEMLYDTIAAHLPTGTTPSIKANQLNNKTILSNCAINFVKAADCKQEIETIIQKFIGIKADSASAVAENFYYVE
ncbi:MAG: ABC transporter substrate-binding protein [Candidatus Coproplasma sp.]